MAKKIVDLEKKNLFSITFIIILLVAIFKTCFVIFLLSIGCIHSNRYTYWNYIGQMLFYDLLSIAYVLKGDYFFRFLTLFIFPIVYVSVFFVLFYIMIILQLDGGWLFISATELGGGTLSVGTVHNFDIIIHVFTVISLLFIAFFGYGVDVRNCFATFYDAQNNYKMKVWFSGYFLFAPLIPIGIYSCFYNPIEQYPTDSPSFVPILIGSFIYLLIVLSLYCFVFANHYGHYSIPRPKNSGIGKRIKSQKRVPA